MELYKVEMNTSKQNENVVLQDLSEYEQESIPMKTNAKQMVYILQWAQTWRMEIQLQ